MEQLRTLHKNDKSGLIKNSNVSLSLCDFHLSGNIIADAAFVSRRPKTNIKKMIDSFSPPMEKIDIVNLSNGVSIAQLSKEIRDIFDKHPDSYITLQVLAKKLNTTSFIVEDILDKNPDYYYKSRYVLSDDETMYRKTTKFVSIKDYVYSIFLTMEDLSFSGRN